MEWSIGLIAIRPGRARLFVEPDVSNEENAEENKHGEKCKRGEVGRKPAAKQDGPRKKKNGFYIQYHEEHGNDVEAGG